MNHIAEQDSHHLEGLGLGGSGVGVFAGCKQAGNSSKQVGASQNGPAVLVFASAKSTPSDRELALAPQLKLVSHDWEGRAACRGLDPSLFFGPNRFEPKRERLARENAAKEICARCPVRHPCHDYAIGSGEAFGVWGGIGETERRAILEGTPVRRAG